MAQGKRLPDEIRDKVIQLLGAGNTLTFVAKELSLPISTVQTIKKRDKTTGKILELRNKRKEEIINKNAEIIELSQQRLIDELKDKDAKISARDLAIINCATQEKQALALGEVAQNVFDGKIAFSVSIVGEKKPEKKTE